MFDQDNITDNGDGTCDVFCDTPEKVATIQELFRGHIDVISTEDAIFSHTPPSERKTGRPLVNKPVVSIIRVSAKPHEIAFALQSAQKMVRPIPHK